jgi:recombinational DNA repair protein RecR
MTSAKKDCNSVVRKHQAEWVAPNHAKRDEHAICIVEDTKSCTMCSRVKFSFGNFPPLDHHLEFLIVMTLSIFCALEFRRPGLL